MPILLLIIALLFPSIVLGQSPTLPPQTNQPLGEIQKIREAIQEKVKEKLSEIQEPASFKKAIIGQVGQLNIPTTMDLTFNGQTTSVLLDPEIVYINSKKSKSSLETIKIGDQVLALGIFEPITSQLTVKRLVAFSLEKDMPSLPQTIYGTITDMSQSSNSVFLSLTPQNDKNLQYQIVTDSSTKYLDPSLKNLLSPKLEVGQKIIIVAARSQKVQNSWQAQRIVIRTTPAPTNTPSPAAN